MSRINARVQPGEWGGPFDRYYRYTSESLERAALKATKRGVRMALDRINSEMAGAGLGRLGKALGAKSDEDEGNGVHRYAGGGFSASGVVFIRSGSRRSRGAIEAYTQGATIRPVRSRWLWIATDNIPRVTGRYRMTPELYRKNGFEQKIGPLTLVRSVNGYPLLVAKNVGVDLSGRKRSARSLTKARLPRKAQVEREFVVAFVGIPYTARAARIDVPAIMRSVASELPTLFFQALGRN